MPRYLGESARVQAQPRRVGVLLSNLGTPDAPTPRALRRYLKEFLSDPRVVEVPRPVWWFVLRAFILPFRPRKVARNYARIWTDEGSPLLVMGLRQRDGLRERLLPEWGDGLRVALGMRYGRPSIEDAYEELLAANCRRILHLPLYPQYAASTTATNVDALHGVLAHRRWIPELRTITQYDDEPAYIEALAASVRELWQAEGESERLLISFHGIPQRYQDEGDPYPLFCRDTGRRLAEALGLPSARFAVTFQSRFGREPWVRPYTDETLRDWGAEGLASVDVICPGFSADCLETLEEIDILNRAIFQEAGGGRFRYVRALNDRTDHLDLLAALVRRHLQGWAPLPPLADPKLE